MKPESVLNVLMYLFKHQLYDDVMLGDSDDDLVDQLEDAGFARPTIFKALGWLGQLTESCHTPAKPQTRNALRVYVDNECDKLSRECRGLLASLEQMRILKPHTREMVINQAMLLSDEPIDPSLIKWITLMVLFTQPREKRALANMEFLVLDNPSERVH